MCFHHSKRYWANVLRFDCASNFIRSLKPAISFTIVQEKHVKTFEGALLLILTIKYTIRRSLYTNTIINP